MTPMEFMCEYERNANSHCFQEVAPLIADDAIYWFNDGSFHGIAEIKQAFERTWSFIRDEQYTIDHVQWLVNDENVAVCTYLFHWQGTIAGQLARGDGRGTNILTGVNGQWKVVHEHLSSLPH